MLVPSPPASALQEQLPGAKRRDRAVAPGTRSRGMEDYAALWRQHVVFAGRPRGEDS